MGIAIELFTNLFQAVMFVSFLYFFFDKPEGKYKRLIPFVTAVLMLFTDATILTLGGSYIGTELHYIDSLIALAILLIYSFVFLKGSWYLRLIMPIIDFGINAVVSYTFAYFVSFVTKMPIEESFVASTSFRYICIVVVNMTTLLFLWLILRFGSKNMRLSGGSEIMSFTVMPVMCIAVMYCNFFAYQFSDFNSKVLPFLLAICFIMVAISVVICVMFSRISRANDMKTEYLLTIQREKLYEESIMASNEQIEKISRIKHETKNKMSSIKNLILGDNTNEAVMLCDESLEDLKFAYAPIHTSSPVLDAILNVELEKAASNNVELMINLTDTLSKLRSADIISVIGNLCDNAIEYLVTQPKDMRKIDLRVRSHLDYYIITCSNKITSSILEKNPDMSTTKEDKDNHGKGISVLKDIAKNYGGNITYIEEDGYMVVTVVLRIIE